MSDHGVRRSSFPELDLGHLAGLADPDQNTAHTLPSSFALYHINGGAFQFTAHNYVTEDFLTGTAVIRGVVTDGPMKGAQVRGQYQIISPCGVINAQKGDGGDFCYRALLLLGQVLKARTSRPATA